MEKGIEALIMTLNAIHPPAKLPAVLKANVIFLLDLKLKCKVINDTQWNLLFPPSGNPPDSEAFDATLLIVLLGNICGLASPKEWNAIPLDADRSPQANIARIKLFRNEVYTYVTATQVDKATFENYWQNISQALVDLKIPQKEVDDLKTCRLSPEDENYVDRLKEWFLKAEKCNTYNGLHNTLKNEKRGQVKLFHF